MARRNEDQTNVDGFDILRETRQVSKRAHRQQNKADLINALRRQRAELLQRGGILETALPNITDQMSDADITRVQRALNQFGNRNQPQAPAAAPRNGSAGNSMDIMDPASVRDNFKAGNIDAKTAASLISGAYAGKKGRAQTRLAPGGGRNPEFTANPPAAPSVIVPTGNPAAAPAEPAIAGAMRQIPFAGGNVLPADSLVQHTGAGVTARVMSESGPRDVAVQPTFRQIMHSRTGGKWDAMSPAQRAQFLRANASPMAGSTGTVVNNGVVTAGFGTNGTAARGVVTPTGTEFDLRSDPKAFAAAQANQQQARAQNARMDAQFGPEAPGMYDANGRPTTDSSAAVRLVGAPQQQGSNATAKNRTTPLGTTTTSDDVVQQFAQSDEDAQFKKKLAFSGISRG